MSEVLIPAQVPKPSSPKATGELILLQDVIQASASIVEPCLLPDLGTYSFPSDFVDHDLSQNTHNLQEINNILSSQVIDTPTQSDTPNPIHPDGQNECHYTLTNYIDSSASNHLNHSSLSELLAHQTILNFEKDRNVSVLHHKRTHQLNKYSYESYFSQCSLMTLLEQNLATQVCLCGMKSKAINGINPTGLCNRTRFCFPCASRAVAKTLKTFQPRFHHHRWGFLTISYDGQLPLNYLSGSQWWLHWDAAKLALKRLVSTGGVNGAMYREELAIPSLSPTTAIPHIHAIVPTDCLSDEALNRLSNWVCGHRDDCGEGIDFNPSIDFRPIPTEEDFVRVIRYLHKPIDLVTPYGAVWNDHASREDKTALNRSMRDLIEAVIMHPKGRYQIDYCGNMRASSKVAFIGVPKDER